VNKLTINWREEIIKLFPETTTRTKGENDEWCHVCKGLGLIARDSHIVGCSVCNGTGIEKPRICECGRKIEYPFKTMCEMCREEFYRKLREGRFEKANKIPFKDYKGMFLWDDTVMTKEDLEEALYTAIYDGEAPPNYIWGTKKEKLFTSIDLAEVIVNKCEDGYEDMETYFNYADTDFVKAQELLDAWIAKHNSILDMYYEDYTTAVLLDEVIEDIKQQIEREKHK